MSISYFNKKSRTWDSIDLRLVPNNYINVIGIPIFGRKSRLFESIQSIIEFADENTLILLSVEGLDQSFKNELNFLITSFTECASKILYISHSKNLGLVEHWNFLLNIAKNIRSAKFFAWGSDHDLWNGKISEVVKYFQKPNIVAIAPQTYLNRFDRITRVSGKTIDKEVTAFEKRLGKLTPGMSIYSIFCLETIRGAKINFQKTLLPDRLFINQLCLFGFIDQATELEFKWERRELESKSNAISKLRNQRRKLFSSYFYKILNYIPWCLTHTYYLIRIYIKNSKKVERELFVQSFYYILRSYKSHLHKRLRQNYFFNIPKFSNMKKSIKNRVLKLNFVRRYFLLKTLKMWLNSSVENSNYETYDDKYIIVLRSFSKYPYVESLVQKIIEKKGKVLIIDVSDEYIRKSESKTSSASKILKSTIEKFPSQLYVLSEPNGKFKLQLRNLQTSVFNYLFFSKRFTAYEMPTWRWTRKINEISHFIFLLVKKMPKMSRTIFQKLDTFHLTSSSKKFIRKVLTLTNPKFLFISPGNSNPNREDFWLREAHNMNIRNGVIVLSWDNPYTKGPYNKDANLYFVWDYRQFDEICQNQSIPEEKLIVSGGLHLERISKRVRKNDEIKSKSRKNLRILYLCSSINVVGSETSKILDIYGIIKNECDIINIDFEILIRPHPANHFNEHDFLLLSKKNGIEFVSRHGKIPLAVTEIEEYIFLVRSCDLILGVSTSAMLEARVTSSNPIITLSNLFQLGLEPHLKFAIEDELFYAPKNCEEFKEMLLNIIIECNVEDALILPGNNVDLLHNRASEIIYGVVSKSQ